MGHYTTCILPAHGEDEYSRRLELFKKLLPEGSLIWPEHVKNAGLLVIECKNIIYYGDPKHDNQLSDILSGLDASGEFDGHDYLLVKPEADDWSCLSINGAAIEIMPRHRDALDEAMAIKQSAEGQVYAADRKRFKAISELNAAKKRILELEVALIRVGQDPNKVTNA